MSGQSQILHSIAKPMHVAFVPVRMFMLNAVCHLILFLVVTNIEHGHRLLPLMIITVIGCHGLMAMAFTRDHHFPNILHARFIKGRRMPWQRTRNMTPYGGNKYVP